MIEYCKYYNMKGYCDLAEHKGYSYKCRLCGEYGLCKNGIKGEVVPEASGQEIISE